MKLKKAICITAALTLVFSACACKKNKNSSASGNTALYVAYQDEQTGLYGFKDENGNVAVTSQFDRLSSFHEDRASVWKNKRAAYIDENGNQITDYRFKIVGDFSNGLAAVSEDGEKWGFIDKDGNVAIDFIFTQVTDFDDEGHAQGYLNGEFITFDKSGNKVTEPDKTENSGESEVSSKTPENN